MINWWNSFWSRKGGAAKDRRTIFIWLIILTVLFLLIVPKILRYGELWVWKGEVEGILNKLKGYH